MRNTNRPIALITDRNITQRAISSRSEVADSGDARDRELRRRPRVRADRVGERALHRVAVDRDRPPVDQIPALRQMRRSGTTSVSGFAGERCTGPVVSCWPAALVTEMIANRGSTASS